MWEKLLILLIRNINDESIKNFTNKLKIPKFPISGEELKNKYGFESGEVLGKKLKALEKKWIELLWILQGASTLL